MIASGPRSDAASDFADDYERLRRSALEGATAVGQFGLVILVREGIAAWMAHASTPPVADTPVIAKHRFAAAPVFSDDSHADMVAVLTNMVLATTTKESCA